MATVFDYLDWRGELSFSAAPMNEVDALLLSMLTYLDFSDVLLEQDTTGLPLEQLAPLYLAAHPREKGALGVLIPIEILDLLAAASCSPRFAPVRAWGHRSRADREGELQFAATSYTLDDGSVFVAFRGTDDTLAGWKEDFRMTVRLPVPAQEEAAAYLDFAAGAAPGRLYLGGHSKGGNLAVYAGAAAPPSVQARVAHIWSCDGPGFLPEFYALPGWPGIVEKTTTLLPRSSIVGSLLDTRWEVALIDAAAPGAIQHNGLLWQVLGPAFVRAAERSRPARQLDRTLQAMLREMDPDQRSQLIEDIFSIGEETGARTLTDLVADGKLVQSLRSVTNRLTALDKDTRESLLRALRQALRPEEE